MNRKHCQSHRLLSRKKSPDGAGRFVLLYGTALGGGDAENKLHAVIVNPCHIFGSYDDHGWAQLILAADRGWLPGVPPGSGTFCHAEQAALAHIAASEKGRTGQNYLLSGAKTDNLSVSLCRRNGRFAPLLSPLLYPDSVLGSKSARFPQYLPMLAASLPALEQRLEARLLELQELELTRPSLPTALARAEAGQRIDELLDAIAELQRRIDTSPAETLEDAAVKLRRLGAYIEEGQPARLLAGALRAVERVAVR